MYLIVTKTFPPEVGGMQNLMWGLANELSKHHMIKVFADYHENHKLFDEQVLFHQHALLKKKLAHQIIYNFHDNQQILLSCSVLKVHLLNPTLNSAYHPLLEGTFL